LFLH